MTSVLFQFVFCGAVNVVVSQFNTVSIRMPNVSPKENESYLCTYKKLQNTLSYAVEFKALAEQTTAHHLLVIACRKPRFFKKFWDCSADSACADEEKIIFAWAKDAPLFKLPKDVGFELGNDYSKYLVVQIHYAKPIANGLTDNSGVEVKLSYREQKYLAGIYLFESSNFEIPPKAKGYHVDMHCRYEDHSIAPFAFRTHAHSRGRVLSAYRIRDGRWHLIGKGNPQEPQAFFMIKNHRKGIIHRGDHLVARCTFDSNLTNVVYPGAYSSDEMCNFYMMYYRKPKYADYISTGCNRRSLRLKFPESADTPINNFHKKSTLPPTLISVTNAIKVSTPTVNKTGTKPTTTERKKINGPYPRLMRTWHVEKKALGQVSGISFADNDTSLMVFHRGDRVWDMNSFDDDNVFLSEEPIKTETLLKIDVKTGKVKKAFGKNQFYMPHGLTVDSSGNIWLTDVAMHQVFKFSGNDFKLLMVLGQKFNPGTEGYHFCKPADIAVSKKGYFFVADGYCNSRVVKFSADGKLLLDWGKPSNTLIPNPGEFEIVHSLSLDDKNNLLYVADRENGRIQVFSTDGVFQQIIQHKEFGNELFAVTYNKAYGGILYAVNGSSGKAASGFTLDIKDKKIINTWNMPEKRSKPHDICVTKDNKKVAVADISSNRVWMFSVDNPKPSATISFPWKQDTTKSKVQKADNIKNIPPMEESKNEKDETLLPAIIVVIVLAFPLFLIIVGMVLQHMHFNQKRNRAVRNLRTNPMHSRKQYRCFGCCMTSEYKYDGGDQAFDKLIKGEIVVDEEDDELFSRKA